MPKKRAMPKKCDKAPLPLPIKECLSKVSLSGQELNQLTIYAFNTLKEYGLIGNPQPILGDEGQNINIATPTVSPEEAEDLPNEAYKRIAEGRRAKRYWDIFLIYCNENPKCLKETLLHAIRYVILGLVGNLYNKLHKHSKMDKDGNSDADKGGDSDTDKGGDSDIDKDGNSDTGQDTDSNVENSEPISSDNAHNDSRDETWSQSRMQSNLGRPDQHAVIDQVLEMAEKIFSTEREKCVIKAYIGNIRINRKPINRRKITELCHTTESTVYRIIRTFRDYLEEQFILTPHFEERDLEVIRECKRRCGKKINKMDMEDMRAIANILHINENEVQRIIKQYIRIMQL